MRDEAGKDGFDDHIGKNNFKSQWKLTKKIRNTAKSVCIYKTDMYFSNWFLSITLSLHVI